MTIESGFNAFHGLEIEELNEFMREVLGLDQGLASTDDLQNPEVQQRFKITSLDQVTWAMRKLGALKAKKAETDKLAQMEHDRIDVWKTRQLKGVEQSTKFFEMLLAEYMTERRGVDPKFKSESTPYGRITFTKQQPDWQYKNEEATADFLLSITDAEGNQTFAEYAKTVKGIADKTKFKKAAEIKRNVFVELGGEDGPDVIVDYATVDVENGTIKGMEYAVQGESVVLTETGEVVGHVVYMPAAAVVNGVYVIPGVDVVDRPDKIDVKAEA